jgi:malonyl-CoA O-methyltransferase
MSVPLPAVEPTPPAAEPGARRPVDAVALGRTLRRLNRADTPPWLHGEVARRMAERLPIIKLQPQRVIDWGAFLGASPAVLAQAYPQAQLAALEPDAARRAASAAMRARPWWSPRRWAGAAPTLVDADEPVPGGAQLLWSNMHLHAVAEPQAVMHQWHRAMAVDGFLMFSTLGPGSLLALRALYAEEGWAAPFAPFVDMHDLGDMLVAAGFADPVMDQETITLTWASAEALLTELRGLGGNADPGRHAGLRTPRWRARLCAALAVRGDAEGRVALEFELVYGHAFRPPPRPRVAAQTAVPLEDLRAMARAGRRRP